MLYSSFYNFHLDKIVGNFSIVCLLCQVRAKSGLRKEIFCLRPDKGLLAGN